MDENLSDRKKGISLYRLNIIMVLVIVAISGFLIFSGVYTSRGYANMRASTSAYIRLQSSVYDLQIGSDYLTEQARYFALTGKKEYINNYFEEANVTKRRDNAVEAVQEQLADSDSDLYLTEAMALSVELMDAEYYSMRLVIEANGYDLQEFDEKVQAVVLSDKDQALSKDEKMDRAFEMLVNSYYREMKAAISENMQRCLDSLVGEAEKQQISATEELEGMLYKQYGLVLVLVVVVLLFLAIITIIVIRPMQKAVVYIKEDKPIPLTGSEEFRFLAEVNNLMHEASRKKTRQLAFQASHDKLTGTFNRSGFDKIVANIDVATAAIMLIDLDRFKEVNDTYGHGIGDKVLVRVADTLFENFRAEDFICRLGGDEFVVIAETTGANLAGVLKKKVELINEILMQPKDDIPAVSVSVGMAFGEKGLDNKELFKRADMALYRMKNSGRAGCIMYTPGLEEAY